MKIFVLSTLLALLSCINRNEVRLEPVVSVSPTTHISINTPEYFSELTPLEIRKGMINRAVRISQGSGGGSGVYLYENLILTAYHVVSDRFDETTLHIPVSVDGKTDFWYVWAYDYGKDLALIRPKGFEDFGDALIPGIAKSAEIGQVVYCAGYPRLVGPYLTMGFLSNLNDRGVFDISCNATFGSSGSAVYNSAGELIGILNMGYTSNGEIVPFMLMCVSLRNLSLFIDDVNNKQNIDPFYSTWK